MTSKGSAAGTVSLVGTTSGANLQTKGLVSGNAGIVITSNADDVTITTGINLTTPSGSGSSLIINGSTYPNFTLRSLVADVGANLSINTVGDTVVFSTPSLNTSGPNVAVGDGSGVAITSGTGNTFVGVNSGNDVTTGTDNTAVGDNSLDSITTGVANVAIGSGTMTNTATGVSNNVAVGNGALANTQTNNLTAMGHNALAQNTTGVLNSAFGYYALQLNTTGYNNSSFGNESLYNLTTGYNNTAFGNQSLYYETEGDNNTAFGELAGRYLRLSQYNTAVGAQALHGNMGDTTNTSNTAVGYQALFANTNGSRNVAVGRGALRNNATTTLATPPQGFDNVAIGYEALRDNTTGQRNVAMGYQAGAALNFDNAISIGYQASATASDSIRLGNASIGLFECQQSLTVTSDSRVKKDIQENVPGINFIQKLRPVTYHKDREKLAELTGENVSETVGRRLESGLLAQEVSTAAAEVGYDFDAIHIPEKEGGLQGLSYEKFVIPLIKAVQEQQTLITELTEKVAALELRLA